MQRETKMKKTEHFMKFEKVSDEGIISGYITKFGEVDSYGTCTVSGCFRSAMKRLADGETIPVLWQHDVHEPIGKFLSMKDDDVGCYAVIQLDLNVERAREAFSLAKNRIISGLSIGGMINRTEWNEKDQVLMMTDIDLYETSVVTFPACDTARIDDCRSDTLNIREMEHAFRKSGMFSQNDSKKLARYFCEILKSRSEDGETETHETRAEIRSDSHDNDANALNDLLNTLKNFQI